MSDDDTTLERTPTTDPRRAAAEQYVFARQRAGEPPQSIVAGLVSAGWPDTAAREIVDSTRRASRPGGWWALLAAGAVGILALVFVVVTVAAALSDPGGPRMVVENLQNGAGFLPLLIVPAPLWLALTGLTVTHVVAYRRPWALARRAGVGRRGARMTLLVADWVLVGLVPLVTIAALVWLGVAWTALGVMCGEAQSANCGL